MSTGADGRRWRLTQMKPSMGAQAKWMPLTSMVRWLGRCGISASSNAIVGDGYKLDKPLIWGESEPVANALPRRHPADFQGRVRLPLDHGDVAALVVLPDGA